MFFTAVPLPKVSRMGIQKFNGTKKTKRESSARHPQIKLSGQDNPLPKSPGRERLPLSKVIS